MSVLSSLRKGAADMRQCFRLKVDFLMMWITFVNVTIQHRNALQVIRRNAKQFSLVLD